jgi:hypothetical protein
VADSQQILREYRQPSPLQPTDIVQLAQDFPRHELWLLLESPWVWLEVLPTLEVSPAEWPHFVRHRLRLPANFPISGNVGAWRLSESPHRTLFVVLHPRAQELLHQLRQTHLVQVLPSVLAFARSLDSDGHWGFCGLEEWAYVHRQAGKLQTSWQLPAIGAAPEQLLRDLLPSHPWREVRLCDAEGNMQRDELLAIQQGIAPPAMSATGGFYWVVERPPLSRLQRRAGVIGSVAVLAALCGWAWQAEQHKAQLRQEVQQLELEVSRRAAQAQPTMDPHAKQRAVWQTAVDAEPRVQAQWVEQVPLALGPAWAEKIRFTPEGAELQLFVLEPQHVPLVLQGLEELHFVERAELRLQRVRALRETPVQQLHIELRWAAP